MGLKLEVKRVMIVFAYGCDLYTYEKFGISEHVLIIHLKQIPKFNKSKTDSQYHQNQHTPIFSP